MGRLDHPSNLFSRILRRIHNRLSCDSRLRAAPVKLGSDNPDNLYENANIDGRRFYRVFGHVGTVDLLGFGTQVKCD